jgi:rhamnose utilization protein RhaD (predicted bifunctional aldolase and dehydrogenase)
MKWPYYRLAAFAENRVAPSIDTPLHAFLPFPHVDHLHPDWAIALAASANGRRKPQEFNRRFDRHILWLPWQRPGFELALMIARAVEENSGAAGIQLGGHGLFTWGQTQRDCYLNSIHTIDQMGEFVLEHQTRKGVLFGGLQRAPLPERRKIAARMLPALPGGVSSNRRVVAHYAEDEDSLTSAGSRWAQQLSTLGTSCPDHFLRTRVYPMFVSWNPDQEDVTVLRARIRETLLGYRSDYKKYYEDWATPQSAPLRDWNPSVVIIPGLGLFGFGKNKKEARITTEFFVNAIHVMAGANALEDGEAAAPWPRRELSSRRSNLRTITITSRCHVRKRFASSTGPWKKPSCSECRRKPSSAARSRWS